MNNQNFLHAASILYYSSYCTISNVFVSYYYSLYPLTYSTFLVLLSSINYWRYPVKGLRRNIDITMVLISLILHLYYSYSFCYTEYLYLLGVDFLFYYISSFLRKRDYYWLSCKFHLLVHLTTNINNIFLYQHIENYKCGYLT